MSFTLVREMGLEPTRQYWLGHLGLACLTAEQIPLPQNQRFRAIPAWLFLMIILCWFADLPRYKNKGHSKIECPLHWCGKWDLNPHANTDTSTSSLPVCRFQHPRKSACLLYQIILHLSSTKIYIFIFYFPLSQSMLHYRNIYLQLAVFVLVPGFPRKILIPAIALAEIHIFRIELLRFFRSGEAFGSMYINTPMTSVVKTVLTLGTILVFMQADTWLERED